MIMPGPIGVTVSRLVDMAGAIQARLWVTHDTQHARPIRLQHVDNCNPEASAKDLRATAPSPGDNHWASGISRDGARVQRRPDAGHEVQVDDDPAILPRRLLAEASQAAPARVSYRTD